MFNKALTRSILGLAVALAAAPALVACNGSRAAAPAASPTPAPSPTPSLPPGTKFTAHLTGGQTIPATTIDATGDGVAVLSPDESTLTVNLTLNGQVSPTGVDMHDAPPGQNGPFVKSLNYSGNTASTVWTSATRPNPLTPALVADLKAGNIYLNVHVNTAANTGGELRGQLVPAP